jgi:hypothetical protein
VLTGFSVLPYPIGEIAAVAWVNLIEALVADHVDLRPIRRERRDISGPPSIDSFSKPFGEQVIVTEGIRLGARRAHPLRRLVLAIDVRRY